MPDRPHIALKRVYDPAAAGDGVRILVERLWPRGIAKSDRRIDHWVKEVAPSPELRRWYGHRPELWEEFRRRYEAELDGNAAGIGAVEALLKGGRATFVFAARDRERNSAVVLRGYLLEPRRSGGA
jgi:uncharacterized protein YeaO (DUF488 family)